MQENINARGGLYTTRNAANAGMKNEMMPMSGGSFLHRARDVNRTEPDIPIIIAIGGA